MVGKGDIESKTGRVYSPRLRSHMRRGRGKARGGEELPGRVEMMGWKAEGGGGVEIMGCIVGGGVSAVGTRVWFKMPIGWLGG